MARARTTKRKTTTKKRPAKTARKAPAKATHAKWDAFDLALEQQIIASPADVALRRVYADWMIEAGNPRGELAALQLAGEAKAEEAFLKKHAEELLGPKRKGGYRYDGAMTRKIWVAGFWDVVGIRFGSDGTPDPSTDLAAMLSHPSSRLLHTLWVDEWGPTYEPCVDAIVEARPQALRKLLIGERFYSFREERRSCRNLPALAKAVPQLEELVVRAGDFRMASFAALRAFTCECTGFRRASLRSLVTAKLPALERLALYVDGLALDVEDLAPLTDTKRFPVLRELALWSPDGELDDQLGVVATALATRRDVTIRRAHEYEK